MQGSSKVGSFVKTAKQNKRFDDGVGKRDNKNFKSNFHKEQRQKSQAQ